ncbi:MAG: helix-turn-helix transcriptional regulator [Clostridia bacterium]|nr:helix-turn-helix transcriptional regulator [Clostridia bacterium]
MIYDFDSLNFEIMTIKRVCHEAGFFSVEGRPFAALAFRSGGSGNFEVDGREFTSKDADILFLPENVSYKVKYSSCEIIVVHFTKCNYKKTENISIENPRYIKEEFEKLLYDWDTKRSINKAKSSIYKILHRIETEKNAATDDPTFKICLDYINENFTNPEFDIPQICKIAGISQSGLLRSFHNHINMSPKKYLTNLRTEYAADLLISGQYSVKEVSEMCGFKDEKYFSRIIKQKYNQPPSAFMKKSVTRA